MARREKTRTFDLRYICLVELLLFFRRHCWIAGLWAARSQVSGEVCGIPDTTGLRGCLYVQNSSFLTSLSVPKSHCHSQPQSSSSSSARLVELMGQVRDRGGKKRRGGERVCSIGGGGGEGWGDCKTQVYVRLCVVSIATFKLYDYASLCTTDTNKL